MKTTMLKNMTICLGIVALSACQGVPQKDLGADFGDAVHSNSAMHIVDPDAGQTVEGAATLYGPKGDTAMKRYLKEKSEADKGGLLGGGG
ncbi:MAG: hypothetical protein RPU64_02390 [Candidatus Sedimenticola sp. (ex Thyasira tokunagai)]